MFLFLLISFLQIVVGPFNDFSSLFRTVSSITLETLLTSSTLLKSVGYPAASVLLTISLLSLSIFSPRREVFNTLLDAFKKILSVREPFAFLLELTPLTLFHWLEISLFLFCRSEILKPKQIRVFDKLLTTCTNSTLKLSRFFISCFCSTFFLITRSLATLRFHG